MKQIYAGCLNRGQHFSINRVDYIVNDDQSDVDPEYIMCRNSETNIYREVHTMTLVTVKD